MTRALLLAADETGPAGWQVWAEPALGATYLWATSFSANVPHYFAAAFAASPSSTALVPRRVLPENTKGRLLRALPDAQCHYCTLGDRERGLHAAHRPTPPRV